MIGRLAGLAVEEAADGTLVVDVQGVGYEVLAPLGTLGRLRAAAPEGPLTFFVHTHVREDALVLFGFASAFDREVFRVLLGVSSIGPKTALGVLSACPAEELAQIVARKELARLVAIPGIGKKTAERLLLELRDKLPAAPAGASQSPVARAGASRGTPGARALLVSALTNMGYKPAEAERAAEAIGPALDELPLGESIREALRVLAK